MARLSTIGKNISLIGMG